MNKTKTCPDVTGKTTTSIGGSFPLGDFVIEIDDTETIPVDSDQLARELLKMQSAFGYRSQAEMLEEYFGGDMDSMINAVQGETK